ncbi:MAG TPA: GTP pyrophosphokinase family protein [Candidatus Anaerobutyricum stercoripullorum]|uniref:GTP pyrophosphokinase family protein n=1 Tax=Candidatus Anaerobutyricum stercoripullorum TaxID=2838456 RepID=A0A9D2BEE9_9FIRM|nr:GTP pyrophosphokinase family protein [Candidatus Anaerobutyricum stercoripullorum]
MEQKKKVFNVVEDMLRTSFGEKVRRRMFEELTNQEIIEFLKSQTDPFNSLMAYYKCALMEIETKFRVLNEEFSLQHDRNPIESIKTRLKSVDSIVEKMHRKNIPFSAENIEKNLTDIAGIRVICSFQEDIYFLASCLLGQDDVFLIEKKDYIANPKPNGYRSLHLIVETPIFLGSHKRMMKVEVQLRTIAMDFWASLEHKLKYKKNLEIEQLTQELKECADESANLDAKMDAIRKRIEQLKQDGEEEKSWKEKR